MAWDMRTVERNSSSGDDPGGDPIVTYTRGPNERCVNSIVAAFGKDSVGVAPERREPLHQWADFDAVETLLQSARRDLRLSMVLWDHPVVITPQTVEIYDRT